MRILLVEDDQLLAEGVSVALSLAGYQVDTVHKGEHALEVLVGESFDLVVLDLGLPGISGYETLEKMRQKDVMIPVLILTAKDQVDDKVKGLDLGADDYLLKPFDAEELKARIRALLRRPGGQRHPEIVYGDLKILPHTHQAFSGENELKLSPKEFTILQELILHSPRILSKDKLTELVYGWSDDPESNSIEVHVHNLRKKVGQGIIETIRGVGYRLSEA